MLRQLLSLVSSSPPFIATLQLPPMRAFTFLRLTDMMMTEASGHCCIYCSVAFLLHFCCCIQCPRLHPMPQGPPPQSTVGVALPRSGVPPLGLRQLHPISPLTHVSPPLPLPCCCLAAGGRQGSLRRCGAGLGGARDKGPRQAALRHLDRWAGLQLWTPICMLRTPLLCASWP